MFLNVVRNSPKQINRKEKIIRINLNFSGFSLKTLLIRWKIISRRCDYFNTILVLSGKDMGKKLFNLSQPRPTSSRVAQNMFKAVQCLKEMDIGQVEGNSLDDNF